ncbi:hypothetical protein [Serratia marcescens]|uniref:hypothetical protein n=1 Tax=Serratia marcescens TaxID=615 RepID=UPI000907A77A|nr:hypothetical protein [Serratia marcescens]
MTLTTEQLSQIKADITARKAMPEYGESVEGNIERLRVIGATRSHFSTEMVEMLVRALEEKSRALADAERERDDWVEHSRKMEYRAIEAKEKLANREAQPVVLNGWRVTVNRTGDRHGIASISGPGVFCMEVPVEYSMLDFMEALTAPPAPAVPGELLDAMEEVIRISDRDHDAWARAKEAITACRAAPPAPAVPEEAYSDDCPDLYPSQPDAWAAGWNACRAAMLAQPVSQRYTLPPHVYRELVNSLRDTAVQFSGTEQLRERLNTTLHQFIEPDHPHTRTVAPEGGNDHDTRR